MRSRISNHIRSNVVGYIALFCFALSGTASALSGSNLVFSDDIVNGQVKRPDLRKNSVTGRKVANNSLTTADINDATLTPEWSNLTGVPAGFSDGVDNGAGGAATDVTCTSPCVGGSEVVDDSLGGADINEGSLAQVPSAVLGGFGRWSGGSSCNPNSATFIDCGYVTLNLPSQSRVLMVAAARSYPNSGSSAFGFCRLATSSGSIPTSQVGAFENRNISLTTITGLLAPGSTDFGIECNQGSGDIAFEEVQVSAVALAAN